MPRPKRPTQPPLWPTQSSRSLPIPAPVATLTGAYPGQRAIRRKPISLPPPGQLTQDAEEDLRASELRAERRAASKKKGRAGKGEGDDGKNERGWGNMGRGERGGKGKPKKRSGLTYDLEMQSLKMGWVVSETGEMQYIPFTSRFVSKNVLQIKEQRQIRQDEQDNREGSFRFLDLPDSVKTRVYRFTVVDSKSCVWPTSPTGVEQPDLSMVCKEIRSAVLPIFYGENTFAVDIAAPAETTRKVQQKSGQAPPRKQVTGLEAVQQWANTLDNQHEGGEWFSSIKSWCFSYQDPEARFESSKLAPTTTASQNRSFVVGIRLLYTQDEEGVVEVEIHRDAACLMPGWADYGSCATRLAPDKLCDAVKTWLQTGAKCLTGLVLEMRELVDEISDPAKRCDAMATGIKVGG